MSDAGQLQRLQRYPLAMYTAGLAVECMLRAFRQQGREHASHHDVTGHFRACDWDRLGDSAKAKLRGPIQTVHMLWLNNFRYCPEARLRSYLNEIGYYRKVQRDSDTLKVACIDLMNAATSIVTIGDERWRNP